MIRKTGTPAQRRARHAVPLRYVSTVRDQDRTDHPPQVRTPLSAGSHGPTPISEDWWRCTPVFSPGRGRRERRDQNSHAATIAC